MKSLCYHPTLSLNCSISIILQVEHPYVANYIVFKRTLKQCLCTIFHQGQDGVCNASFTLDDFVNLSNELN